MCNSRVLFKLIFVLLIQTISTAYAVDTKQSAPSPGVMTSYEPTIYDGKTCLNIAERCLKQIGYSESNGMDINDGKFVIWGDNGSNRALIRCVPDHNLVYFIAAGPDHAANVNATDALPKCY